MKPTSNSTLALRGERSVPKATRDRGRAGGLASMLRAVGNRGARSRRTHDR
jgi:hypothetical protein